MDNEKKNENAPPPDAKKKYCYKMLSCIVSKHSGTAVSKPSAGIKKNMEMLSKMNLYTGVERYVLGSIHLKKEVGAKDFYVTAMSPENLHCTKALPETHCEFLEVTD